MSELLNRLSLAIADGDEDEALKLVEQALSEGIPPFEILDKGGSTGMNIVNERYENGEAFLPELVIAGDTMKAVVNVIFSKMSAEEISKNKLGKVVIGQAKGDVHDIGKNLVAALLGVNGFEVFDLGVDVPLKEFIEKAKEVDADIIACSTLLTTSMPYLEDIDKYLRDAGLRDKYFYIVGGGPVTPQFAEKIGADGWGLNAFNAVELCKQLMKIGKPPVEKTLIIDVA